MDGRTRRAKLAEIVLDVQRTYDVTVKEAVRQIRSEVLDIYNQAK